MEQKLANQINQLLTTIPSKYDTKGEMLLYRQGILVGLLVSLSMDDSKNMNKIIKRLKQLSQV